MRVSTKRHREVTGAQILPPVQIRTTGQPISIADSVTNALVFAFAFAIIAWLLGFDPRTVPSKV